MFQKYSKFLFARFLEREVNVSVHLVTDSDMGSRFCYKLYICLVLILGKRPHQEGRANATNGREN